MAEAWEPKICSLDFEHVLKVQRNSACAGIQPHVRVALSGRYTAGRVNLGTERKNCRTEQQTIPDHYVQTLARSQDLCVPGEKYS